jgi:hypothetical protein
MDTPDYPIIFHYVNPNELDRNKIRILKVKHYENTDTFEMLIQKLLKKYKNLYSKEKKLYIGDFTLLYKGSKLKTNARIDKVQFSKEEPIILLLNKYNNTPVSLQTALSVMNVLFPNNTSNINDIININTNINTNSNSNINTNSNSNINSNSNSNVNQYLPPSFVPDLPLPISSNTEDNIQTLIDMGFSEPIAKTAIQNTNSLEEAINLLVGYN